MRSGKPKVEKNPHASFVKRPVPVGVDRCGPVGFKAAPKRSQDVVGYKAMLPSGVAWLGADEWSMTFRFFDINYVAATESTQEGILDRWARYLNSFGAGTRVQTLVLNRVLSPQEVSELVHKRPVGDDFDALRHDFNGIVDQKLSSGSGNTVTEKFITITIREEDRAKAEATLERMFHEAETYFSTFDSNSKQRPQRLGREERLELIARLLRPGQLFGFTEEGFAGAKKSASTLDYVAPFAVTTTGKKGPVQLSNGTHTTLVSALWVRDYPVWLTDRLFSELAEVKGDLIIAHHLEPYDPADGSVTVNRYIAELEMQQSDEEKRAEKQKRSKESIPYALKLSLKEAHGLREELSDTNQKLFSTLLLIGVAGSHQTSVEDLTSRVSSVLRKLSIPAEVATYMQRDALTTMLPTGRRMIPMRRVMTTSAAAVLIPFTTQELMTPGGLWYGTNAQSGNPLIVNRAKLDNGNGFILGKSGSGKGVAAKSEITNVLLDRPNDDVIIIDPEREYEPLVKAFDGETVRVGAGSDQHVNWMDIDLENPEPGTDPVMAKCAFVLSVMQTLVGGSQGLTPPEKSAADRASLGLYRRFAAEGGDMPTPGALREELIRTGGEAGARLAEALELYTTGSLSGFSQPTNVNPLNRLVSWDISGVGSDMRGFAMMVILDQIWARVLRNFRQRKRTWIYVDEFHMLFNQSEIAALFRELFKRIRKYLGMCTGITQNLEELLVNADARLMLANCEFLLLLGQAETDADALVELLNLSEDQRRYFMGVQAGEGLIRAGSAIVPFNARVPKDTELYKLWNTTIEDV